MKRMLWLILPVVLLHVAAGTTAAAGKPEVIANSLGMKLVLIAPGEFLMGSPPSEEDRSDDELQHRVRITRALWLGRHEVTVGQFRQFVDATVYQTAIERDGRPGFGYDTAVGAIEVKPGFNWHSNGLGQTDDQPVVNVNWDDATAFCRWLSAKESLAYRLPTEAEWEYSCRAGTTTRCSSGNAEATLQAAANLADASFRARYADATWSVEWNDRHAFTSPVGSFAPNPFGLCDMHGNVWEWCADWYAADYYARSPLEDPRGPAAGQVHVLRGGAFTNRLKYLRSADRDATRPKYRYNFTGFRVAQTKS